jgi:serine/threonine protein phosphatase PrpC
MADDDLFCEIDGTKLAPVAATRPMAPPAAMPAAMPAPTPKVVAAGACPGCGARDADDGDGYCNACGRKLRDGPRTASVPEGASLAGGVVTGSMAADTLIARGDDGRDFLIALGDARALDAEARALETLAAAGTKGIPRARGRGDDAKRGAYLALEFPTEDLHCLARIATTLPLPRALDAVESALARAETIEAAGFALRPAAEDLAIDASGAVVFTRLREAAALASTLTPTLAPLLAALGVALLPDPLAHAAPAIVRQLCPSPARGAPVATVASVRAAIAEARAALTAPHEAHASLATLTHPGCKKAENEDSVASARGEHGGEPWTVLVVCDGVSCSTHAEMASTIAAETACAALAHFARSGDLSHETASVAVGEAIRAAHVAICAQRRGDRVAAHDTSDEPNPPGTTIVAALVHRRRATVGWVGDSRAYWITARGGELLTRDHSWINETVERGEMSEAEAMTSPYAHALTRCLGPLEVGEALEQVSPEVRTRDLAGPGELLLCSDGMWNYFPEADALRAIAEGAGVDAPLGLVARRLVNHALARGGHDNVTVAIYRHR